MNHTFLSKSPFRIIKGSILATALLISYACSSSSEVTTVPFTAPEVAKLEEAVIPTPDPRVGLGEGLFDAEQAIWNLEMQYRRLPSHFYV